MNSVPNLILEVGINHFGDIKKAKEIINFFIKSKFTSLTFMLHTEDFCKKYLEKKKNRFYITKKLL